MSQPWSESVNKTGVTPPKTVANQVVATGVHQQSIEEINNLLDNMQPVDKINKKPDVLVYGDTNAGKTFFSMTCPEPIFVIDTERRADKTKKYHYPNKDIRVFNPVVIKTNYVDDEDAIDYASSIDNITNFLVAMNQKIQEGKIKEGTLVVDSLTDIWKWVQEWAMVRLAKKGRVDKDLLKIKNQFDWGVPNGKNARLMDLFKNVTSQGLVFVGTSREQHTPEYIEVKALAGLPTDKIRVQKDVPFGFGSIVNLRMQRKKMPEGFKNSYFADIIKLDTLEYNGNAIENFNYEKLLNLIAELGTKMTAQNAVKTVSAEKVAEVLEGQNK